MSNTITIIERPDLKTSEIMDMCRKKFKIWSYYDDKILDEEFPAPKTATTRHFLNNQEPDPATLGLSVNQAEEKGYTSGITFRERLLLELAYFEQTGEHLDLKGITFCSGSRYSGGGVPRVRWLSGNQEVQVGWYDLGRSDSKYGLRSAVYLETSSSIPSGEKTAEEIFDGLARAIQKVKAAGYKIYKEI